MRRYLAEFCTSLILYFVIRVRCRPKAPKESSRSPSHLLMSFLSDVLKRECLFVSNVQCVYTVCSRVQGGLCFISGQAHIYIQNGFRSSILLARLTMFIAKGRSVCLSVCPSVTLVIHTETVQDIEIHFTSCDTGMFLVPMFVVVSLGNHLERWR